MRRGVFFSRSGVFFLICFFCFVVFVFFVLETAVQALMDMESGVDGREDGWGDTESRG